MESRRAIERKADTSAFGNISDWRPGLRRRSGFRIACARFSQRQRSGAAISAVGRMTALESNQSPRKCEPVSSRHYATRRGKGILRLETGGGRPRLSPKSSVSAGLPLQSRRASAGYVGDIQRDGKSCNINWLRGGARRNRTDDLFNAIVRTGAFLDFPRVSTTLITPRKQSIFALFFAGRCRDSSHVSVLVVSIWYRRDKRGGVS